MKRGTGAIEINGNVIYAFYERADEDLRVRISLDEWELLRLSQGEWVWVFVPGCRVERVLLVAWSEMPPWCWLGFERVAAAATAAPTNAGAGGFAQINTCSTPSIRG